MGGHKVYHSEVDDGGNQYNWFLKVFNLAYMFLILSCFRNLKQQLSGLIASTPLIPLTIELLKQAGSHMASLSAPIFGRSGALKVLSSDQQRSLALSELKPSLTLTG